MTAQGAHFEGRDLPDGTTTMELEIDEWKRHGWTVELYDDADLVMRSTTSGEWAHARHCVAMPDVEYRKIVDERDEARRQIIERIAGEWGGYFLVLAADRWGRDAALELYPAARLRDAWADRNFGVTFANVPDEDDRTDIEEKLVRESERLDEMHPATE